MESERLYLRAWQEEDAATLYRYASHPEVGPHAGWAVHQSVEESLFVIREYFSNDATWAIVPKNIGEPIGCIGYYTSLTSNIPIGPNDCEVGYWVGRPFWNQGFCTEALQLLLNYCFHVKRFASVWADHFVGNPASGRVLEKCGFSDTGLFNTCSHLLGGDREQVKIYRLDVL